MPLKASAWPLYMNTTSSRVTSSVSTENVDTVLYARFSLVKTPSIINTMPATARKISGTAGSIEGSSWLIRRPPYRAANAFTASAAASAEL